MSDLVKKKSCANSLYNKYSNRKVYIEFIRIIAIILVIFNHTGEKGFKLFFSSQDSPFYVFYLFASLACKVAVPLFWMCSGALLLPKEESIKQTYSKRFARVFGALVIFSFVYFVASIFFGSTEFDLIYFLKRLYTDFYATTYWYLYAYLGMLMLLPLLRKLVKGMTDVEFKYLFVLGVIINGLIPIIDYLLFDGENSINEYFVQYFPLNAVICFISGYYLENVLKEEDYKKSISALLLALGLVSIIVECYMTHLVNYDSGNDDVDQTFYQSLIFIPTFAIYYSLKCFDLNHKCNRKLKTIICVLGGASFGVMLIEEFFRILFTSLYFKISSFLPTFISCLIWVLIIYAACTIVTLIMKKIPILKRFL